MVNPRAAWRPCLGSRIRRAESAEHRHEEGRDLFTDQWQRRKITQAKPPPECSPLRLLGAILQKFFSQRHWDSLRFRKGSTSPLKSALDRTCKRLNSKVMGLGQSPDVEEVLHSAVRDSKNYHGMEFLRDHGLWWICTENWSIERQEHWESDFRGRRINEIAEPDVDLHRYAGAVQTCGHPHSDPFVFRILLDALSLDAANIKDNPVVCWHRTDFTNSIRDVEDMWAAESEKVEIFGRSVEPSFPCEKEHRPLEDEIVLLDGSGEAV